MQKLQSYLYNFETVKLYKYMLRLPETRFKNVEPAACSQPYALPSHFYNAHLSELFVGALTVMMFHPCRLQLLCCLMHAEFSLVEISVQQTGQFSTQANWLQSRAVISWNKQCWVQLILLQNFIINGAFPDEHATHAMCTNAPAYQHGREILKNTLITSWIFSFLLGHRT